MRFVVMLIWALLISSALAYILTSMASEPFNMTQAIGLTVSLFIGIAIVDGVLSTLSKNSDA